MPYTITDHCIGCGRCEPICPSGAIHQDVSRYAIDASQCNECNGSYGVPQCWAVCPTNEGCVFSEDAAIAAAKHLSNLSMDYWDGWFMTYNRLIMRLKSSRKNDYWQSWFQSYASALSHLDGTQPSIKPT